MEWFELSKNMVFALKEEIGNTSLFSGRKSEIASIIDWTMHVKKELSLSIALLARRKKGKTTLVQRLP